ncbi:MAG: hypothetical protein PHS04_12290 [Tissierellia bacterium]|nr:hypothetical protein [Tissierellia bacterium]
MINMFNIFSWLGLKKRSNININSMTINDYYDRLKTIALSLFEWKGLPDSCNSRFLELTLYTYGRALFIEDPATGFLNMRCVPSGRLNHYDEPVSYTAYSTIYNREFMRDECVLIRNNLLEKPTENTVLLFAIRLTEAERTIDTNIKAQKTPVLIRCDDKDRLTMQNLYKKYDGNEPFILGGKSLNIDGLKVLKTDAPFVADKLQVYKRQIWNEALTFFGVNNANTEKRERLITDEVKSNEEVIYLNSESMLLTRQQAAEDINKKYGLNVSVEKRNLSVEEIEEKGEGEDGEIYD